VGFKFSPGNSKKINRYRGQAAYTTLGALIGRFYDYNAYIDGEWESIFNSSRIEKAIGKKTLEDLKHLIPENVYFEKLIETWPFPTLWINRDLQYMEEVPSDEDIRKSKYSRITMPTFMDNIAMQKLAEKVGFIKYAVIERDGLQFPRYKRKV